MRDKILRAVNSSRRSPGPPERSARNKFRVRHQLRPYLVQIRYRIRRVRVKTMSGSGETFFVWAILKAFLFDEFESEYEAGG